jgi:hypothetical protein
MRFDARDQSWAARIGRKVEAAEGVSHVEHAEPGFVQVVMTDGRRSEPVKVEDAEAYLETVG